MAWVALVGPEIEENLSLRYLSACLRRAGFSAEILRFDTERDFGPLVQRITADPPLIVGLSLAFQWRAPDFLALACTLREGGYEGHITVGGHFGTFASRELLTDFPEIDTVCRQEAEETLVHLAELVRAAGRSPSGLNELPGLAYRAGDGSYAQSCLPRVPDLSELPFPDRSGTPAKAFDHGIAPLVSSRGCYANCTFCCIAAWHEQTLPGKRYRLRDPESVADEMAELHFGRGIDVFVFHDDNFFIPNHKKSRERLVALADALEVRGVREFGTVVKARPNDVERSVFDVLVDRLRCLRCYVGIETDADQGLSTLQRWAAPSANRRAIEIVREMDLFVCFNVLLFDPDTTMESLRTNVEFMRWAPEFPFNFSRVELYAGTPLLARMQREGRVRGDYLQWDYDLGSPEVERAFSLAMQCFTPRNFGSGALANDIQAIRFDLSVARHFHPDRLPTELFERGRELSVRLAVDTAEGLTRILDRVAGSTRRGDAAFVRELSAGLRGTETQIRADMLAIAEELTGLIGRGRPITTTGDVVATPLQRGAAAMEVSP